MVSKVQMKRLNDVPPGATTLGRRFGRSPAQLCTRVWNFRSLLNNKRVKPTRLARRGRHLKCPSVSTSVRANYLTVAPTTGHHVGGQTANLVCGRADEINRRDHRRVRYTSIDIIFVRARATDTISILRRCQLTESYCGFDKVHTATHHQPRGLLFSYVFVRNYFQVTASHLRKILEYLQ